MQEMWVGSLGQEDALEKDMATHSNVFTWEITRTKEPGGLQSMGSQRVRHDWATKPQQNENATLDTHYRIFSLDEKHI